MYEHVTRHIARVACKDVVSYSVRPCPEYRRRTGRIGYDVRFVDGLGFRKCLTVPAESRGPLATLLRELRAEFPGAKVERAHCEPALFSHTVCRAY